MENQYGINLPLVPASSSTNGHLFYLVCRSVGQRNRLIDELRQRDVYAVFHYLCLHKSPFYEDKYAGEALPCADRFAETLIRLPLFYELTATQVEYICEAVKTILARDAARP